MLVVLFTIRNELSWEDSLSIFSPVKSNKCSSCSYPAETGRKVAGKKNAKEGPSLLSEIRVKNAGPADNCVLHVHHCSRKSVQTNASPADKCVLLIITLDKSVRVQTSSLHRKTLRPETANCFLQNYQQHLDKNAPLVPPSNTVVANAENTFFLSRLTQS